MFNWRITTKLTIALLCLPLLHLAYIWWEAVADYVQVSPDVWADDMQAIIKLDQRSRLPAAPILITGGRSVRLWKDLPASISSKEILRRPLGDATLDDIIYHYDRLIGYYRPSVLVIMPSYSDLYLRDNKTAVEMATALDELLSRNVEMGATVQRYVVVPVKTLLHRTASDRIAKITEAAVAVGRATPNTAIIDPNPLLAGPDGAPNPEYFGFDGIYLNEAGYAIITAMLLERLSIDASVALIN